MKTMPAFTSLFKREGVNRSPREKRSVHREPARATMTRRLFAAALIAGLLGTVSAPAFAHSAEGSPVSPVRVPGTIVDIAVATPQLSTLVTAVSAANLVDTLKGKG